MATAIFSILVHIENDSIDFTKSEYFIVDKEMANVWSPNVTNGTYYFLTYEVTCNGTTKIEGLPTHKSKLNISGTFIGMLHKAN